jgi:transposase InsO family protein
MGAERKREVIELVRRSPLPTRRTLEELGIPRSTYYRWQRRFRQQGEVGLVNRRPQPGAVWNSLTPQEEETILQEGLRQPELSSRELACWVTDHAGFSVSESSICRLLKRHGLIREVEGVGFPAGQEHRVKTTRINEQWQSDASHFFVVGWGWYYLISVLDDYSRFISPYHPQTNGKRERFHETLKARLNLLVFTRPEALCAAMGEFIEYYNYRRYHEGIGNVTPADVYYGRREEIPKRRKAQKQATLDRRFQYNLGPATDQSWGELGSEL